MPPAPTPHQTFFIPTPPFLSTFTPPPPHPSTCPPAPHPHRPHTRMGLLDTFKRAISGPSSNPTTPSPPPPPPLSPSSPQLAAYFQRVDRINALEVTIESLSDLEIAARVSEIRAALCAERLHMDDVLEEVFALVREATFRVLGLRHYDVQLVGAMVLHHGAVAEMATGEGKTIVALLAACLNALGPHPVLVVTVNDYLAKRDAELVGQVLRFLGLSVGLVQLGMPSEERRTMYACDVVYVTNSELGFDYLRDHLAMSKADVVLERPLGFCIVDEADSILIDEARTPLIISGKGAQVTTKYVTAQRAAAVLARDVHYTVNEKEQAVTLTERGYRELEQALKVSDLFDVRNPWAPYIVNALKAKEIFKRDVNYIVAFDEDKDKEEIQIVDEFTGRAMKGRRWSDGLHQAVEAKEGIPVETEATVIGKVSYQAFFQLFEKLSGMTGTAATEAQELKDIYGLDVTVVPTALPKARKDYPDVVFKNAKGKYVGVMREIARVAPTGRPILIGTTSVEASEALSDLLTEVEVDHDVLNAKPESALRESEIIAQAGRKFSITIATNMAGRGTDILLGGNADYFARALARRELVVLNTELLAALSSQDQPILIDDEALPVEISGESMEGLQSSAARVFASQGSIKLGSLLAVDDIVSIASENGPLPAGIDGVEELREAIDAIRMELKDSIEAEREEVLDLGGLYIIGTERSESKRVDNQLRGRAGRQGDPGSSRFFLSLDDRLFRLFGGEKVTDILTTFRVDDETPIENSLVNQTLDSSQEKVEDYFRNIRNQLYVYDEVLAKQRSAFYAVRQKVVLGDKDTLLNRLHSDCEETALEIIPQFVNRKDGAPDNYEKLSQKLEQFFAGITGIEANTLADSPQIKELVLSRVDAAGNEKHDTLESSRTGFSEEVIRYIWLTQMDNLWQEHMKRMDFLKEFIVLRAYSSDDPLTAYQTEGFAIFNEMLEGVRRNSVYSYFQYKRDEE